MPARFINVSNSGRARFTNVNNSGRAIFGEGGIAPTTTTTVAVRLITVNARLTSAVDNFQVQYSYDAVNFTSVGSVVSSTSCAFIGADIPVNNGTAVSIRVVGPDLSTTYYYTRAFDTAICPTYDAGNRSCNGLLSNVTANRTMAITINVSSPCP